MKSIKMPLVYTKLRIPPKALKKPLQSQMQLRLRVFSFEQKALAEKIISKEASTWQKKSIERLKPNELFKFESKTGFEWILIFSKKSNISSHSGQLEESEYGLARDLSGQWFLQTKGLSSQMAKVETFGLNTSQLKGIVAGINIAAYSFKGTLNEKPFEAFSGISFSKEFTSEILVEGESLAKAVNLARHLVNLPPNYCNPQTISDFVKTEFSKDFKIEVWNEAQLKKEGMGLLLGVGAGSNTPPRLVVLKYSPKGFKGRPIALVGKGITFDTGGLDIKPSAGMRLMKKDMGGAAALVGVASWLRDHKYKKAVNVYLALAENSVDANSIRPSDVLTARNGLKVEIHNTDAEGRLVLADAIDVALDSKPEVLVDVATLTGAIKVALGGDLAGLFSNDDKTAHEFEIASQAAGDLSWRMPLFSRYWSAASSPFADFVNAIDGFGGAITAALFLEKFVKNTPWVHLDIYAWADRASGPLSSAGGSGQSVQMLVTWLESRS